MNSSAAIHRSIAACANLAAAFLVCFSPLLYANPKGAQVTNGNITITELPGLMTINQTTPRGIIHWQDFSIGAGELTQFQHLDAKSATLNRVVGGIPTTIQGTLQANGQVYIVNPNGILIGPGGRINTAAFVASTLDVPDAQFMAGGDMRFSGNSLNGVVNLGSINATDGDVILMGHYVQNAGTISAPNGTAALAAGNDILLQPAGDERVVVNSGIPSGGNGVENSGRIEAARAELKAAGGSVYALAINNTGVVKATGIAQTDGRIILSSDGGVVQNSGQLIAKNADGSGGRVRMDSGKGGTTTQNGTIDASADNPKKNGGTVELLGDTVNVGGSSVINVNGANAGTVAIGVSAQIANQTTATGGIATVTAASSTDPGAPTLAQQTTIQANSRIMANSTANGNGGRIVVWSEQKSTVGGVLEAKAGDQAGNGGLVETSGRTGLTIIPGTKVDTAAPKGKAGTWLLDPAGITIDAGPTDTDINNFSSPTLKQYQQNAATNHVDAGAIALALGSGDVDITTSGFPSNADIVVNSAISLGALGGNHTLSFHSAGGIDVNAAIGGAASDVILTMQTHGDVNINSGGSIQMNGVSIFAITGSINVADQILALNDKNIFLNAPTGSIAFTGSGYAGTSGAGAITLDTHLSSAGTITSGSTSAVSAGKLVIASGTQGVGTSGSPFVTAVDDLSALVFRVPSNASSGGGVYIKNTSGGTLHLGNILVPIVAGFGGAEINNTAGTILLDNFVSGDHIAVPGNIKLTAGGASSDIRVLNTNSSSINSHNGSVTLTAGRDVQIGDAGTNIWGVWVLGQTNVDVHAGGDVTVAGSELKAGGASGLSITAGGNVNMVLSSTIWSVVGTSGNVPVNITTGAGKTFNLDTSSQGGVLTNLADNISGTLATGANITIKADSIFLGAPVNAGTGSTVVIAPVTAGREFDLGTGIPTKLSFSSNAEINEVKADTLIIGGFAATGDMTVSANISPLSVKTLTLLTQGDVTLSQSIIMSNNGQSLNIAAGGGAGISGTGSVDASNISLIATNGSIVLPSSIKADTLNFQASGNALFQSPVNQIGAINATSSNWSYGQQIRVEAMGNFAVNGALGKAGSTTYIYLHPGANNTSGNLTLNSGASITANTVGSLGIDLNIGNGSLINNAGAAVLDSPSYTVWQSNLYSSLNKEGLIPGTRDTSDQVQFPNSPLADPKVFYYGVVSPPVSQTPSAANQTFVPAGAPARFNLRSPTLYQQVAASPYTIPFNELEQAAVALYFFGNQAGFGLSDKQAEDILIAYTARSAQQQQIANQQPTDSAATLVPTLNKTATLQGGLLAGSYDSQKQLTALAAALDLFSVDDLTPAMKSVFFGDPSHSSLETGYVNPSSLSPDQLNKLSRPQALRLLALAGYSLSSGELKLAQNAKMTQGDLVNIFKAGPIDNQGFAAIVAAGGGNLTMSQILDAAKAAGVVSQGGGNAISNNGSSVVSQGGGNAISNNGSSVVSQGGGNAISNNGSSVVSQGGGNFIDAIAAVVSQGGGNLTFAAVVSQGGGNAISNNGSSVVSQGGGNLLTSDGAGVVSQGGGNFYAIMAGMIGSDGMGLLAKASAVVSQGGGNAISNNGSGLVGSGGASAISNNGSSLIGHDGASLIGHDGASLIGNSSSALQLQGGAGAVSGAMNNK